MVIDTLRGLVDDITARGEDLIGGRVENGVGAVQVVRGEDDGACARGCMVVVENGADAHFGKACVSDVSWSSIFGESCVDRGDAEVAFEKAILLN